MPRFSDPGEAPHPSPSSGWWDVLPSGLPIPSAFAIRLFRGSISRPTRSLSTLRSAGCPGTTQDSLPAGGLTFAGQDPPAGLLMGFVFVYMTSSSSRLFLAQGPARPRAACAAQETRAVHDDRRLSAGCPSRSTVLSDPRSRLTALSHKRSQTSYRSAPATPTRTTHRVLLPPSTLLTRRPARSSGRSRPSNHSVLRYSIRARRSASLSTAANAWPWLPCE
jgi:hypothetical protein